MRKRVALGLIIAVAAWTLAQWVAFRLPEADSAGKVADRAGVRAALAASVVLVAKKDEEAGCGGTLIAPAIVLTAAHCLGPKFLDEYWVVDVRGTKGTVLRVHSDGPRDLALLYLAAEMPGLPAKISSDVAVGDRVIVIGAPGGEQFLASFGSISRIAPMNFNDPCDPKNVRGTATQQILVHDALNYFGNSGGGVFDSDGALIGVSVRTMVISYPARGCGVPDPPDLLRVTLWGMAVGPDSVLDFLREAAR